MCVLFKGKNIWAYRQRTKLPGYPKKFAEVYPGVTKNVDAAYHDERSRITYFFQANLMWKFDERNRVLLHEAEGLYTSDEFENLPYAPNAAFQDDDGKKRDIHVYLNWKYPSEMSENGEETH